MLVKTTTVNVHNRNHSRRAVAEDVGCSYSDACGGSSVLCPAHAAYLESGRVYLQQLQEMLKRLGLDSSKKNNWLA